MKGAAKDKEALFNFVLYMGRSEGWGRKEKEKKILGGGIKLEWRIIRRGKKKRWSIVRYQRMKEKEHRMRREKTVRGNKPKQREVGGD